MAMGMRLKKIDHINTTLIYLGLDMEMNILNTKCVSI